MGVEEEAVVVVVVVVLMKMVVIAVGMVMARIVVDKLMSHKVTS